MAWSSRHRLLIAGALALAGIGVLAVKQWRGHLHRYSRPDPNRLFVESVGPTLQQSCVRCHGPDEQKGDLRLDSREAMMVGGQSGPVLVPGDPAHSLLLKLVRHQDHEREMPPKSKLKDTKIAALEGWIQGGAPWPGSSSATATATALKSPKGGNAWSDPNNPIARLFGGKRLDLWSLKPLADPAPPLVKNARWVRNPLDAFVLAKLAAAGEQPAPEADRRTLARRLYFDLTGLPPTPEEMRAFLADSSREAYSRLVDKLLDSPRYGEHWARFWLDVVRYSDSNGFDYDEFRPNAWRYRDYVVRALNEDKPYDRFVREQLAGDEMVAGTPQTPAEQDCLVATGYLRIGPFDSSAVLFGEKDRGRAQVLFDMVETAGSAFLGLNMSCCRCHDHKIDPISQCDYYRLQAVFENVEPNDDLLLDLPAQLAVIQPEVAAIRKVGNGLEVIEQAAMKRIIAEKTAQLSNEDQQLLTRSRDKNDSVPAAQKEQLQQILRTIHTTVVEARESFNPQEKEAYAKVKAEVKNLEQKRSPYTPGFLATDAGYWPPPTHLLAKGDYTQPKEQVEPGGLSALTPDPLPRVSTVRARTSGRRTAFVDWLFSRENPLTARVMVNRLWLNHFSEGLLATPNDFGFSGARPADPLLLDWLAQTFRRQGWSLKTMHRLIVESATYRQGFSTAAESRHAPFCNQKPHRLTAEELRDSMLAVSGRLLPTFGGPPVWPELPKEVLNSPNLLIENEEKTRGWYPSPHEKACVRSLYLVQKRSLRLPMLETFDQPESNLSCGRRNVSTVAPQALTLLNSPFATEMAESFASRLLRETDGRPDKEIERAFLLAFQRLPEPAERAECAGFLQTHHLRDLCLALMNANEFAYVD